MYSNIRERHQAQYICWCTNYVRVFSLEFGAPKGTSYMDQFISDTVSVSRGLTSYSLTHSTVPCSVFHSNHTVPIPFCLPFCIASLYSSDYRNVRWFLSKWLQVVYLPGPAPAQLHSRLAFQSTTHSLESGVELRFSWSYRNFLLSLVSARLLVHYPSEELQTPLLGTIKSIGLRCNNIVEERTVFLIPYILQNSTYSKGMPHRSVKWI